MLDINAPIIPFVEMGNIKLYSTMKELTPMLNASKAHSVKLNENWVRYDIDNVLMLFFHIGNQKLFKICTQSGYKGKLLNSICTETSEDALISLDPDIVYDDFEEVWESPKGYYIETDVETGKASWISIFINEVFDEDFETANW